MASTGTTIQTEIDRLKKAKADIKAAILEKGVNCDDTLATYANRIKAIPSPKIEEGRMEEVYVSSMEDITITPSEGYDAMSDVLVSISVEYNNVKEIRFKSVPIAKGVSFNIPLDSINGVDLITIQGLGEIDDFSLNTLHIVASISTSDFIEQNFILGEVLGGGDPIYKMWLCKYQYNTAEKMLTITVLQEIPISAHSSGSTN